jgi:hypothetical protein
MEVLNDHPIMPQVVIAAAVLTVGLSAPDGKRNAAQFLGR